MSVPAWVRKAAPGVLVCLALIGVMPLLRRRLGFSPDVSRAADYGLMVFMNLYVQSAWRQHGTSLRAERARKVAERQRAARERRRR